MTALSELVCGEPVRSVMFSESPSLRVHEVLAGAMLESVTSERGHRYSFAASTMAWVDGVLQVRMNAAAILRREVHRRSWRRDTVALGVTVDPYHPVEERYRLMPQVLSVLSESRTPVALHTASTLVLRDLPLLRLIGRTIPLTVSIPLPVLDPVLATRLDPEAASPMDRLRMIEQLAAAGLSVHVRMAPLPPLLADGAAQLEELLDCLSAAGADRVSVSPLRLGGDDGVDFLAWLADEHPALVRRYRSVYGRRDFVSADYAMALRERMAPMVERHGLGSPRAGCADDRVGVEGAVAPRLTEEVTAAAVVSAPTLF